MFFILALFQIWFAGAELYASPSTNVLPVFPACGPESDVIGFADSTSSSLSPQFCAQWNPEFPYNGNLCCGVYYRGRKKRKSLARRGPGKPRGGYCSEITVEQKAYIEASNKGESGDVLSFLTREIGKNGDQAYCTVNNGFLAHGRPILPNPVNRLVILSPHRCLYFGTDAMAAMLEWLGREVGKTYVGSANVGTQLPLGDISGPKGGPLYGPTGRRGHASHTTGQDADVGFLSPRPQLEALAHFPRTFNPHLNWWLLKRVFKNPFACVKVIFLDRKLIRSLTQVAQKDKEWKFFRRFIRHMPGHKNHLHIRIGNGPGQPGCGPRARPELEVEEDIDSTDYDESALLEDLEELKSRQSTSIQE